MLVPLRVVCQETGIIGIFLFVSADKVFHMAAHPMRCTVLAQKPGKGCPKRKKLETAAGHLVAVCGRNPLLSVTIHFAP